MKERRWFRSIKNKVIFLVVGQLVLTLLAVIFVVLFLVNQLTSEQAEMRMVNKATALGQKLEQRMLFLAENVERLTANQLVVNAVIDRREREAYLPLLVDNFMRGKEVISLSLIGTDGKVIYENHNEPSRFNDSMHLQMALALNKPVSYIDLQSKHFITISPISYLDTHVGMALIAFDLGTIVERLIEPRSSGYVRLVKSGETIFSHNFSDAVAYRTYAHLPQADTPMMQQLSLLLEIGFPQDEYDAPIQRAIFALLILGAVCLFLGVMASAWIAGRITQPIMKLYGRIRQVHQNEACLCYPLGSGDELEDLARAFDERTLKLQFQAQHDSLTGLPNRTLFLDRLEQAINMASRNNEKLAVLFVDMDRFKEVNDSLGHDAGDELLIAVSAKMQASVRSFDTVARLGGDEFCVLLNRVNENEAIISVLQKLVQLFQQPIRVGGQMLTVTCSIGVAIYPENGVQPDELLKQADAAMYRAKDEGRNTYEFFTHDLTEQAQERLTLENDLRRALHDDQFTLYYQPQISLGSGELLGLEALVRWQHPQRGLMAPDRFIPLAEESGLIIEVDRWVMRRAMQQLSTWLLDGYEPVLISLNVSMIGLQDEGFVQHFEQLLNEYQLPAECFMFEVTETQAMRKPEKTIVVLKALKALGVRLAIDDFGTGFSSLSYLKRFPVDRIKIDKSFINGLPEDLEDVGLTQAIIALSRSLRKEIIAEGVETLDQSRFLAEQGCVEVQGFLYYPPLPVEEVTDLLVLPVLEVES